MSERNHALIDCWLSGQMSYAQWIEHLRTEPGLQREWDNTKRMLAEMHQHQERAE